MVKILIVTGTSGSGKSTVSKKLSVKLGFKYLHIDNVIRKFNLCEGIDQKLNSKIVDVNRLNKVLINLIKESKNNLIIDGHLSHYLSYKYVNLCIVCKCELNKLRMRLCKKKYSKVKIRDNLDSEIFDVCLIDALENKHNVLIVDTTQNISIAKLVNKVKNEIDL